MDSEVGDPIIDLKTNISRYAMGEKGCQGYLWPGVIGRLA